MIITGLFWNGSFESWKTWTSKETWTSTIQDSVLDSQSDDSENPHLRVRSRLELWSRSWHGLHGFLEQSFLVRELFYNDTFVDVLFRGLDGDRKSSRCLPNTSTFVPNDRSQCLPCVLPIMRCARGTHLDVALAERRTPCRFVGNLTFPSLFLREDVRLW